MKILFATWELDPFFKFGGLGDVARSLPGALKSNKIDIRIIIPFYKTLRLKRIPKKLIGSYTIDYAGKSEEVNIFQVQHPGTGVDVYLLENKKYLSIAKSQDTFAFFDKAVVEAIKQNSLKWKPEIVHCNDHHCGLIPLLLKEYKLPIKSILTIHNLSYQGSSSLDVLEKTGLDKSKCKVIRWEIKSKQINFLMEGIIHADVITTVSPTYAKEIMQEEYGEGMEEILKGKEGKVFGILNGIDTDFRALLHSRFLKYPYRGYRERVESSESEKLYPWDEGKLNNKLYLQKKLGLTVNEEIPMFSFIGRFVPKQKGIEILHKFMRRGGVNKYQFVILGTGSHIWEERYQWLCTFYPKNVSCNFRFDEVLAYRMYAASDFILIPSKFEPCGLIQMIAMSFGTLPIAHKTGGLADSITNNYNGFLFEKYTSGSLSRAVTKAVDIWQNNKNAYRTMVRAVFTTDFSWKKSAKEYIDLYKKLLNDTI